MRIRFLLLCGFVSAGCAARSVLPPREPSSTNEFCSALARAELHAHRGAADRPENMLTAFRRGFEQGADAVEMDLQITKDNHIVVAHDAFVKPECTRADGSALAGPMFFRGLLLSEVKALDCGSHVPPGVGPVAGEKISTLDEVLAALQGLATPSGRPTRLNIEIKYNPSQPQYYPDRKTYVSLILSVIRESGIRLGQFMIQSFDVETLAEVHRQWPQVTLSPLLSDAGDGVRIAKSIGASLITPHSSQVSPDMLTRFHAAGLRVIPWTVNDALEGRRLLEWGVDGIISDRAEWYVMARQACGAGVNARP